MYRRKNKKIYLKNKNNKRKNKNNHLIDKRNDKNKQCNELFFFGTNFGHRHEHESVLDIAPIAKYA